jgi:hypothetical protein
MSKGPGRIERAIEAIFANDPDNAFTVVELCRLIYPSKYSWHGPPKKQRVAVTRAAKGVVKRHPELDWWRAENRGGSLIFLNHERVLAYGMARLKQRPWGLSPWKTNADFRKELQNKGNTELMAPGGFWWFFVQEWIAERDGDQAKLAELKAAHQVKHSAGMAELMARFPGRSAPLQAAGAVS